jgi:exopolyphosphatase/pppGpp-phosphohydrolase
MHLQLSLERNLGRDRDPDAFLCAGVEPARVDTVLLAHVVMIALCEGLGAQAVHVTGAGLRSGVALHAFRVARARARFSA